MIDLVSRVFTQFVAPLFSDQGVKQFMTFADPAILVERIEGNHFVLVAEAREKIIGTIEIRAYNHIALFFVDPAHQRRGVGRQLLRAALAACIAGNPALDAVTVNASPNAVCAYKALGFTETDEEKTTNGIRYIQMSLKIGEHPGNRR